MRDGDINVDELFDVVKKKPTELRLEEVDKMVAAFPLAPTGFDWSSIINLNSIIMTSVSAFIIAGSLMLYTSSAQNAQEPLNEQSLAQISQVHQDQPLTGESLDLASTPNMDVSSPDTQTIAPSEPAPSSPEEAGVIPAEDLSDQTDLQEESEETIELELTPPVLEDPIPEAPEMDSPPEAEPKGHATGVTAAGLPCDEDARREFNLSGFTGVSVGGSFDVHVSQSNSFKVWAEGDEKSLEQMDLTVKNGTLEIKNKKNQKNTNYYGSRCESVTVHVEMPTFDKMSVAGSGDLTLGSFNSLGKGDFDVAGSGSISVDGELEFSGKLDCSIAGSGDMNIDGSAWSITVHIAGSGDFKGLDLQVDEAKVSIAGSGSVGIHANKTLDISIAGSGDIEYIGNPSIKQSIAGSGSVQSHR